MPQKPNPAAGTVPKGKTGLRNFFDKTKDAVNDTFDDFQKRMREAKDNALQAAQHVWKEATKWHYEDRDAKNKNLPSYNEVIIDDEAWNDVGEGLAKYHQNGIGSPEMKFTNKDGREAVYTKDFSSDGSYKLYTDSRYKGTYNYVTPSPLPGVPDSITDFEGIGNLITDGSKFLVTGTGHFFLRYASLLCIGK